VGDYKREPRLVKVSNDSAARPLSQEDCNGRVRFIGEKACKELLSLMPSHARVFRLVEQGHVERWDVTRIGVRSQRFRPQEVSVLVAKSRTGRSVRTYNIRSLHNVCCHP